MFICNPIGLAMTVACFLVAFGVGWVVGATAEDQLMILAGPLLLACDLLYRMRRPAAAESSADGPVYSARTWLHPDRGGHLFYLPIWAFGVFWMVLGGYRLLSR